jgi:hypothetical protein
MRSTHLWPLSAEFSARLLGIKRVRFGNLAFFYSFVLLRPLQTGIYVSCEEW